MSSEYKGDVVFRDGVHYPIKDDVIDMDRPLRTDSAGGWRDAEDGEALHNDANHLNDVEFEVGS